MQVPDLRQSVSRLCAAVLLLPLLAVPVQPDGSHLLAQVQFCQPGDPDSGLLKMFDEDQMFSYNFSGRSATPWIREFDKWTGDAFPDHSNVSLHARLCSNILTLFTNYLKDIVPENRGGTQVTVFTAQPLSMGMPNTLICHINDVYPPALTITWRKNGEVLSRELDSFGYFALWDQTFQAFSYLNATPQYNDVFSCDVQVSGDNRTLVSYWVPDYPVPSDLWMNALCGLALALGIIFLLLGFMFLYLAWKLQNAD